MCNTSNAVIMATVVEDLVENGQAFTAFDATQEGMQRGTTERHRSLKGQVHANMKSVLADGSYEKSLVPTPTGEAWLYHPAGYDVQGHIDDMQSVVKKDVDPSKPVDDDGEEKLQRSDSEGRLPIYGDMLRAIGCFPRHSVQVGNVNDEMVISKDLGIDAEKAYTVNADGRIRIGPIMLESVLSIMSTAPRREFKVMLDKGLKRIVITL